MATRVALVTGSSSGIGLGIARRLVKKHNVILTGLADDKTKDEIYKEFDSIPGRKDYHFVDGDLATEDGVSSLCIHVTKLYPEGLDILVNNAGIQHVSPLVDFPIATWHKMLAIHLTAPFTLMQRFMPGMMEQGLGRIVNTSSINGMISMPNKVPYTVTKWGLIGMIKGASLEGAEHGVTCNAVCPGWVETELVNKQVRDMAAKRNMNFEDAWNEFYKKAHPTGKAITTDQVASLVEYLCSDDAHNITGTAIPIDGGYTAR